MDPDTSSLELTFDGPFAWWQATGARCLFEAPEQHGSGIYLWTVRCGDRERVYYVGETGRSFGVRMNEHLREYLCGAYVLYEPSAFASGKKIVVWPGSLQWRQRERMRMSEFVERYEEFAPTIRRFVKLMRFWLAPFESGAHRPRKRIEAALAAALRANAPVTSTSKTKGLSMKPRNGMARHNSAHTSVVTHRLSDCLSS